MSSRELSPRARFRQAGRTMLRSPGNRDLHAYRVLAACHLDGAEPLQGAITDLLFYCSPDLDANLHLLRRSELIGRLAPFVTKQFVSAVELEQRLPRVTSLATRFSILAMPSLDVPRRAMLCGIDDSHELAAQAIPALLAGDTEAEETFLTHCEGAGDSLAFMLASRAMSRANFPISARWSQVSQKLQKGVHL